LSAEASSTVLALAVIALALSARALVEVISA